MPAKHKASSSSPPSQKQKMSSNPVGEGAAVNEPKRDPDAEGNANPPRAPAPPADKQWREHEHHVPTTPGQTKDLAKETGSPELAKHVTKQAQEETTAPQQQAAVLVSDSDKDAAARQVGYESFAALVDDSTAVTGRDKSDALVCELHDGRWIRFQRDSWPKFEAFRKREEAMPEHNA